MARPEGYKAEQMIEAIRATKGMISLTARRLGCAQNTVRRYIEHYPTVKAAHDEERVVFVDTAELKFMEAVNNGEAWAIAMALKTLGKDRGYVEAREVRLITPEQAASLTEAEIDAELKKRGLL